MYKIPTTSEYLAESKNLETYKAMIHRRDKSCINNTRNIKMDNFISFHELNIISKFAF